MDAKKCDRCGNFYTEQYPTALDSLGNVIKELVDPTPIFQGKIESIIDLCPQCSRDLTKWLKMKPAHKSEDQGE